MFAAMCNAVMDKVKFHPWKSVFNKWFPKALLPPYSKNVDVRKWLGLIDGYDNKYINGNSLFGRINWKGITIPVQICDLWHFSKTLMIITMCLAVVLYEPFVVNLVEIDSKIIVTCMDLCIYGTAWNITFSMFFNKLLAYEKVN